MCYILPACGAVPPIPAAFQNTHRVVLSLQAGVFPGIRLDDDRQLERRLLQYKAQKAMRKLSTQEEEAVGPLSPQSTRAYAGLMSSVASLDDLAGPDELQFQRGTITGAQDNDPEKKSVCAGLELWRGCDSLLTRCAAAARFPAGLRPAATVHQAAEQVLLRASYRYVARVTGN